MSTNEEIGLATVGHIQQVKDRPVFFSAPEEEEEEGRRRKRRRAAASEEEESRRNPKEQEKGTGRHKKAREGQEMRRRA